MNFLHIMNPYLKIIAQETRKECESFAIKSFPIYYFMANDLEGMCASASLVLKYILNHYQIKSVFIERISDMGGHCWLKINDIHMDITATQFGGPPIYIHKFPYPNIGFTNFHDYYYRNSVSNLRIRLMRAGWDECQILDYSKIKQLSKKIISKINLTYPFLTVNLIDSQMHTFSNTCGNGILSFGQYPPEN